MFSELITAIRLAALYPECVEDQRFVEHWLFNRHIKDDEFDGFVARYRLALCLERALQALFYPTEVA